MKMNLHSNGSIFLKYFAFASVILVLVVTYNYIDLSHRNSYLKTAYDERIKELEHQQAYTSTIGTNKLKRLEEDINILTLKLGDSSKTVESLRQRLDQCQAERNELDLKITHLVADNRESVDLMKEQMSVINENNEFYKKMCQKHTSDAIESFEETIVNMANRLGPDDSRKLLEYLNILDRFNKNATQPIKNKETSIVSDNFKTEPKIDNPEYDNRDLP